MDRLCRLQARREKETLLFFWIKLYQKARLAHRMTDLVYCGQLNQRLAAMVETHERGIGNLGGPGDLSEPVLPLWRGEELLHPQGKGTRVETPLGAKLYNSHSVLFPLAVMLSPPLALVLPKPLGIPYPAVHSMRLDLIRVRVLPLRHPLLLTGDAVGLGVMTYRTVSKLALLEVEVTGYIPPTFATGATLSVNELTGHPSHPH
jgi:hypothetical protein